VTLTRTRADRDKLAELKREIAAITGETPEERKERRAQRRARDQAVRASKAPGKRDVREREPAFLAYLRRQPCEARDLGGCSGPIEAAHIRYSDAGKGFNPGMGRKNHDRHANPLCRHHHQHDQHTRAERAFWDRLGKDAYETAARHHAAFRSEA
jgi:hypothetical protein